MSDNILGAVVQLWNKHGKETLGKKDVKQVFKDSLDAVDGGNIEHLDNHIDDFFAQCGTDKITKSQMIQFVGSMCGV